ncbi:hypothetical protein DB346_15760 [Verrucomicrobia bacterium LW23]|nr:hypothetical protein DB346_15760 [Verrucomicrobia bacterium LW23]
MKHKISYLLMLLFAGFCAMTSAEAGKLSLTTNPAHFTVDGQRYVIVSLDDSVSFSAAPEHQLDSLSWSFTNGEPGSGTGNGPHVVQYTVPPLDGSDQLENVTFTSHRQNSTGNPCVTTDKITCKVAVASIRRAVSHPEDEENFEPVTETNRKVYPGQKMILECNVPFFTVQEYKWEIPGTIFKHWTAGQTSASLTQVPPAELTEKVVRFYWASTGMETEVICKVKINNAWHNIKVKLDIERPITEFTKKVGEARMKGSSIGFYDIEADNTSIEGMDIHGKVQMPDGEDFGEWNWVQLVTTSRQYDYFPVPPATVGKQTKAVKTGLTGLDGTYPFEPSPYASYPGGAGSWLTSTTMRRILDSPKNGFNPPQNSPFGTAYSRVAITNESFVTYMMFLPPGHDSRYVPLLKMGWSFKIEVARPSETDPWAVVGIPEQMESPGDGDIVETSEHPVWDFNSAPYLNTEVER